MIEELENRAAAQLPPLAPAGSHAGCAAFIDGHEVLVRCRVDLHGRHAFGYTCDGVRIERRTLLKLLCPEAACEEARAVRERWAAQHAPVDAPRAGASARGSTAGGPTMSPLLEEVPVKAGDRAAVARRASFTCLRACPVRAHEPRVMTKAGWDLFIGSRCVAGGVVTEGAGDVSHPRFETLRDAAAWLAQGVAGPELEGRP